MPNQVRNPAAENPYAAPQTHPSATAHSTSTEEMERLKGIAASQRWVIFAMLGYFIAIFLVVLLQSVSPTFAGIVLLLSILVVSGMSIYGTFTLASRLYNPVAAILLTCLGLILSFFLLLFLSAAANRRFKKAGLKVGLLGVPPSEFT